MSTVLDSGVGVGGLDAALRRLHVEDLNALPGGRLDEQVVDLHRAATRLEAEQLRWLGEWERQGVWALDGSKSAAAALARRCGMALGTARDRLRTAVRLREAPVVAESFADGRLTLAKVRLLVGLVGEDRTETLRSAFTAAEAELVRHAEQLSVRDTAFLVNHFAAAADPDGHEADWDRQYANNRFHLAESMDGCGHLDGFLDPEATQIARHALGILEDRLYRDEHHRDADPDQPKLTATQRRAAAFIALCQSVLDDDPARDDNLAGVARPLITAILDATTAGTNPDQPSILDDHHDTCSGGCGEPESTVTLAANNVPLPRPVAQRLLCDAVFVRVLTKAGSVPLDVGRASRHPTTAIARALLLRDGGCAFPGCETPPRFCHAHHIHFWEHGGPTSLWNFVLVCRHHHRLLHELKWRCRIDKVDGLPRFITPDGVELAANPTPLDHARTARRIAAKHRGRAPH
jgi:hypothetical protein